MKTTTRSIFREALALVTVRLVLAQLGLGLAVFGLFVLWLRVPDETVFQLSLSVLLGLVTAGLAGLGESRLILRLGGRAPAPWRLIGGGMLMLAAVALWFPWAGWLDHQTWNDPVWAGYINSRMPRGLRHFFPFERLLLYLGWMWSAIAWIGAGVLISVVFVLTASARPLHAAFAALRSAWLWLVLPGGTAAAAIFTGALLHWVPVHGLRPELTSLALRLAVVLIVDTTVACCLLATLGVCVRRADAPYPALETASSGGGPEESQPRTAETP